MLLKIDSQLLLWLKNITQNWPTRVTHKVIRKRYPKIDLQSLLKIDPKTLLKLETQLLLKLDIQIDL